MAARWRNGRDIDHRRQDSGKFFDEASGCYTWKYGMTIDEIADMMCMTRANVVNLLYRGLKKLKNNSQVLAEFL